MELQSFSLATFLSLYVQYGYNELLDEDRQVQQALDLGLILSGQVNTIAAVFKYIL